MRSAVDQSHQFLAPALHRQAVCVDATLGNGNDTAFFLAQGVRKVIAFEVQEDVLSQTQQNISDSRLEANLDGHEHMDRYIHEEADAIVFNFGYCPGKESLIHTMETTSLEAVKIALRLLKVKGRMALVFYPHPEGIKEAESIIQYLKTLDPYRYAICCVSQLNHSHSPYWVGIEKKKES
ncbi:class I SAM-dependent methyltransferase [uncultured Faecalicoccus sp.]|uniref:tRNA (mnm(5)s(2)U34)-methyltransferase n=1 Tax=uncultured Faecalicoccus sp. TaxID=1971760 RepID=UPI00262840AA|nr:class I SAM-dependent methyltransferase [uncultured Faecalicoccus sp.]